MASKPQSPERWNAVDIAHFVHSSQPLSHSATCSITGILAPYPSLERPEAFKTRSFVGLVSFSEGFSLAQMSEATTATNLASKRRTTSNSRLTRYEYFIYDTSLGIPRPRLLAPAQPPRPEKQRFLLLALTSWKAVGSYRYSDLGNNCHLSCFSRCVLSTGIGISVHILDKW